MTTPDMAVFIDPSYEVFYGNKFFEDGPFNRDEQLAPYIHLKRRFDQAGIPLYTADYLIQGKVRPKLSLYYSFGITRHYRALAKHQNVRLRGFWLFEPPVVMPGAYRDLSDIARHFDRVIVHNTDAVGYPRFYSGTEKLQKLMWPQPFEVPFEELWNKPRQEMIVLINSNKRPNHSSQELYSERIRAVVALSRLGKIDLHGPGWSKPWYKVMFPPYWLHRSTLRKLDRGPVDSKYEALSRYQFALCFENMIMPGYITEKIFDCFFVGTVPVYLGASDIDSYVPRGCYVDMRDFKSYADLHAYLAEMKPAEWERYRQNIRKFLGSSQFRPFTKDAFAQTLLDDVLAAVDHGR